MKGFFSAFKDIDAKLERICRETGNTKKLETILKKKHPDLNKIFFDGFTPLQTACMYQKYEVVRFLLADDSVDVTIRDNIPDVGSTILHVAAWRGCADVMRLILSRGKQNKSFDINAPTHSGFTALHYACAAGHIDTVLILGQAGASPHAKTKVINHLHIIRHYTIKDGSTPLHLAVKSGHLDITQYLIDTLHADLNAVDNRRCSVLHHACWEGHRDIIAYLFERGVDFELQDSRHRVCIEVCRRKDIQQFASALFVAARDQRTAQSAGASTPLSLDIPVSSTMDISPPEIDLSPAAFRSLSLSYTPIGDGLLPDVSLLTPQKPMVQMPSPALAPAATTPVPASPSTPAPDASAVISPEAAKRLDESQAALAMANQLLQAFNQVVDTAEETPSVNERRISPILLDTIKEDEITSDIEDARSSGSTPTEIGSENISIASPQRKVEDTEIEENREKEAAGATESVYEELVVSQEGKDYVVSSAPEVIKPDAVDCSVEVEEAVVAANDAHHGEGKNSQELHDQIHEVDSMVCEENVTVSSQEVVTLLDEDPVSSENNVKIEGDKVPIHDDAISSGADVDRELDKEFEENKESVVEEKITEKPLALEDAATPEQVDSNGTSTLPSNVIDTLWKICKETGDISALQQLAAVHPDVLSPMIRDWDQWTPLIRASYAGHADVVQYLLKHGADVEACDGYGFTALHRAAWGGRFSTVQVLVEEGSADVNATNPDGYSALHKAAMNGNADICLYLLSHGASIDSTNSDGFTALHLASKRDHVAVIKTLVEHGADVSATARNGETCVQLAKSDEVRKILLPIQTLESGIDTIELENAQPIPSPKKSVQAGMHTSNHVSASSGDEPELVELAKNACLSPSSTLESNASECAQSPSIEGIECENQQTLSPDAQECNLAESDKSDSCVDEVHSDETNNQSTNIAAYEIGGKMHDAIDSQEELTLGDVEAMSDATQSENLENTDAIAVEPAAGDSSSIQALNLTHNNSESDSEQNQSLVLSPDERSPAHIGGVNTSVRSDVSPPNSPASRVCEMHRILEDDNDAIYDISTQETLPSDSAINRSIVADVSKEQLSSPSSSVKSSLIKPSSSDKRQSFMSRLFEYAEESDTEIAEHPDNSQDTPLDVEELNTETMQADPVVSMLDNILTPLDQRKDDVHRCSSPTSSPKGSQRSDNIVAASVVNGVLFDEISEDSDVEGSDEDEMDIDDVPDIQVLTQLYSGTSRRVTGGTPPPKDLTGPYLEGWKYLGQVVKECNAIEGLEMSTSPEADIEEEEPALVMSDAAVSTTPISTTHVDVKWVFFMGSIAKIFGSRKVRRCTKAFYKWKYATTAELSIIAFSPNRSINRISPQNTPTPVRRSVSFSPDVPTPMNLSVSKYSGVKLAALVILRAWRTIHVLSNQMALRNRFAKWKFITVEFAPVVKKKELTVECAYPATASPNTPVVVTPVRTSPRNSDSKVEVSSSRSSPRNSDVKVDIPQKQVKAPVSPKVVHPPAPVEPEIDLVSLGPLPLDVMPLLHMNEQTLWTLFTHYAPNKLEIPPQTWPERKRYSKRIHNMSSLFILFRDFNVSPFLCNKSTLIRIIDSLDLTASQSIRNRVGNFGGKELNISFSGFWKILWAIARDCLSAPSGKDPVSRLLNLLQRMDGSGGRAKMASGSRDAKLLPPFQFIMHTHSSPQKPQVHKYSTSIVDAPETPGSSLFASHDVTSQSDDTATLILHCGVEEVSTPLVLRPEKEKQPEESLAAAGNAHSSAIATIISDDANGPTLSTSSVPEAPQTSPSIVAEKTVEREPELAAAQELTSLPVATNKTEPLSSPADMPIMFNKSPIRNAKRSNSAGEAPQAPSVTLSPGRVPRRPLETSGYSTPTSVGSPALTQTKGPRGLSAKMFPAVGIALDVSVDAGNASPSVGSGSRDGKYSPAVRREVGPSTPLSIDEDEARVANAPPPAPTSSPAVTNEYTEGQSLRQRRNPSAKAFNLETQISDTGTASSAASSPLHGETIEPHINFPGGGEGGISKVTTLALLWMEKSADRSRSSNTPRRRPSTTSTASSDDGERRKVIGGGAGLIQRDGSLSKMTSDSRDSPRDMTDDDVAAIDPNSSQFESLPTDTLNVPVRGSLSSASDSADPPIPSTPSSENSPFSGSPRIGTPKRRPSGITRRR